VANANIGKAARTLLQEHRRRAPFRSLVQEFRIADIATAYAVQRQYVRLQSQERASQSVGYKVGLTSSRMQAMCGIDSPIAGVVLADRVLASGARLNVSEYGRLGLEFEIAVRLGRDLGRDGGPIGLDEVAEAVDAVCPAIEVVDDRGCDYKTLDVLSLVADNSWNAGMVLGEFRGDWPDLAAIEGIISVNDAAIDKGFGRDVLNHPFHSVAWVAGHLANTGGSLRAGDIVMTGNFVTTKFPTEPSHYRFDIGELGSVALSIAAEGVQPIAAKRITG
jgi:2-keto-4-pentenoate hydratase